MDDEGDVSGTGLAAGKSSCTDNCNLSSLEPLIIKHKNKYKTSKWNKKNGLNLIFHMVKK